MMGFLAFVGTKLFEANNDIVRLKQGMNLLVTPDMQIVPSGKHATHELARAKLTARLERIEDWIEYEKKSKEEKRLREQ